ncbi:MAG: hypothetical protein LBP68_08735 [Acidobacteriota bacterium]|jgi:hypothetical protein|nr:hypothetical protein [Acidobacteriota bacterium]
MRALRIYLETTIFNFYFEEDRGFAYESTVALFNEIAAGKYNAYTSTYVTDELEQAPLEKKEKMMRLINKYNIAVLAPSDEAVQLADIYVDGGIIPQKYRMDGLHIAIAAVNNLDMIVSMNFQHIVKRKTKITTGNINALNGYRAIEIATPMEVVENESD